MPWLQQCTSLCTLEGSERRGPSLSGSRSGGGKSGGPFLQRWRAEEQDLHLQAPLHLWGVSLPLHLDGKLAGPAWLNTALARQLLFFEQSSMKLLVLKNLTAHKLRNKMTSIIFSLAIGFIIFVIVTYNL